MRPTLKDGNSKYYCPVWGKSISNATWNCILQVQLSDIQTKHYFGELYREDFKFQHFKCLVIQLSPQIIMLSVSLCFLSVNECSIKQSDNTIQVTYLAV